jgi:hypothetical protein
MDSFKKRIDEKEMTPAQLKRREDIVLSLKKKKDEFKERYGSRWEDVMYATATKMAMRGEETDLDEKVREIGATPRFGFKTGDSTRIPLSKKGKSRYSWRQPNPNRMDDGLLSDKQLKFLRKDFERFEEFGPKTHKLFKQIIDWLFRQEDKVLVQLAELKPRIRWLSHYAYNRLVSSRVKVKSKIFGVNEKIRMLNYGEDITYVVNKKTRKVEMGPVSLQKAKEFVKKNGGGWKYTISDRPQLDKKVGDKLGVFEQKQSEKTTMKESPDVATMTFEFPNNRKAKAFAYDISNSAVATGQVIGKKVEVEPFDFERKTHKAIAKYMKKHGGELIDEDAPANSAGSGAVSGFTPDTVGVSKKKQKKHKKKVRKQVGDILMASEEKTYSTFMEGLEKNIRSWNAGNERIMVREKDGHPVFIVSKDEFSKCKSKRKKFERWSKFFDPKSTNGKKIKEYSHKNPSKPIVLQCSQTGEMIYLRRRLNDARLRHNKRAKDV